MLEEKDKGAGGAMTRADYGSWPRQELFAFFSSISDPFYSVSFSLEVSRLYEYVKAERSTS